jgi:carboxynorspermidine decarboxylase
VNVENLRYQIAMAWAEKEFSASDIDTPALVYDELVLTQTLRRLIEIRRALGVRVLFSVKALSIPPLVELIAGSVDGLSVSSLFEAMLAHRVAGPSASVHMVTPALVATEVPELARHVDAVSFNSLSQWRRFAAERWDGVRLGLRVNPQLSFVRDERYDPCRRGSKLGIPIDALSGEIEAGRGLTGISGLHLHSNCDSRSWEPLDQTARHVAERLGRLLPELAWINLGGGYLFDEIEDLKPLERAVERLRGSRPIEIFLEPGEGVVGRAGSLVTTVLDLFESDGRKVAVVDTTVNHYPLLFEYQYQLAAKGADPQGEHAYLVAGRSCLAGDLFGEYRFHRPLAVGSRIELLGAGAYALVRATMFNGINLPTLYLRRVDGALMELRRFGFDDFWRMSGAPEWRG